MADDLELEEIPADYFNNEEKLTIYTTKENIREIVGSLGYFIDEEEYIVDKSTGKRITTDDNSNIKLSEIGVILPHNSPHQFVKNNLGSLALHIASKNSR